MNFECVHAKSLQSFSTLSNPLNCSSLLCPWDSPGENTGVGCHALLQGIFLTQGLKPGFLCLLHWQVGFFFTTSATWETWGETIHCTTDDASVNL